MHNSTVEFARSATPKLFSPRMSVSLEFLQASIKKFLIDPSPTEFLTNFRHDVKSIPICFEALNSVSVWFFIFWGFTICLPACPVFIRGKTVRFTKSELFDPVLLVCLT